MQSWPASSAALQACHRRVRAQGLVGEVQTAVVEHLGQRRGGAHVAALELLYVFVQGGIADDVVPLGIALPQALRQTPLIDQHPHLRTQLGRIGRQVLGGGVIAHGAGVVRLLLGVRRSPLAAPGGNPRRAGRLIMRSDMSPYSTKLADSAINPALCSR